MNREQRVRHGAETLLAIRRPGVLCAVGGRPDELEETAYQARQLARQRGIRALIEVRGDFVTIEPEDAEPTLSG